MKNLKLAVRQTKQRTVIKVSDVAVGRDFVVIAGPCSVESEEQTRLLQRMNCDVIQGFVVSRPVPAERFATLFLAARRRLAS